MILREQGERCTPSCCRSVASSSSPTARSSPSASWSRLWVSGREVERLGIDRDKFYDMGIWLILSAIVGARLFHVLVYWREYAADPLEIFRLWNGGLVFYGGLLAAVPVCYIFLRKNRIPFLPVADVSAVGDPAGAGVRPHRVHPGRLLLREGDRLPPGDHLHRPLVPRPPERPAPPHADLRGAGRIRDRRAPLRHAGPVPHARDAVLDDADPVRRSRGAPSRSSGTTRAGSWGRSRNRRSSPSP